MKIKEIGSVANVRKQSTYIQHPLPHRVGRVTFKKESPTVTNYLLKIVVSNVIRVPQFKK